MAVPDRSETAFDQFKPQCGVRIPTGSFSSLRRIAPPMSNASTWVTGCTAASRLETKAFGVRRANLGDSDAQKVAV